jgi:hypothetical protein
MAQGAKTQLGATTLTLIVQMRKYGFLMKSSSNSNIGEVPKKNLKHWTIQDNNFIVAFLPLLLQATAPMQSNPAKRSEEMRKSLPRGDPPDGRRTKAGVRR